MDGKTKKRIHDLAWESARVILKEALVDDNSEFYAIKLYEMQFVIYQQLKKTI